jgi:hypothetical protein
MRTRKEIEDRIRFGNSSIMHQGLILEVLLDIRDLLPEKGETTKAQLCPVCLGSGKTSSGLGQTGTVPLEKTCHGCGGRGWVEIHESPLS